VSAPVTEKLRSYGGDEVDARVYRPGTVDELRAVLAAAGRHRKRVTFRGGGHAFDTQALNDDVVISLEALTSIEVDAARATVTAGPGARWGQIVAEASRQGMVPYVTVTTKHATAAGTASSDCVSRFSPSCGKEGWHILSLRLITMTGDDLVCSREQHSDVFFAAVGGLGYLGAIAEVRYRLLRLGYVPAVESRGAPCRSFAELAKALVPRVHAAHARRRCDGPPVQGDAVEAIYAVCFQQRALLFHSRYVDTPRRKPLAVLHQPEKWRRRTIDLLLRINLLNRIVWWFIFTVLFRREHTYIDGLEDYTFFMDGNVHAKELGRRLGFKMRVLQQTFIVPAAAHDHEPAADAPLHETTSVVTGFLDDMAAALAERRLVPTLIDIMFVPRDEGFLLSSSSQLSGYGITYAFDTSNEATRARARDFLIWATRRCRAGGGRVSLVKNVCADADDIAAMYGDNLERFLAMKRRLDPDGLIRNGFFERVFPGRVRSEGGQPDDDAAARAPRAHAAPERR
jgi:decaprenylphospho-beta-D-ribofuranose 2-oxidase